ncbi:helix-loop-helix DNA-binding domain-containing protein [Stagonosporopsis vannaccii]|nr:helix-loop-helix DNA-binding domain-containing protein [Stagonosporopsis vannaccii]
MALNWDAFLNTESLNIPHDQWSDLSAPTTGPPSSDMPKSISSQTSGSTPEDATAFDTLLNSTSADPYFDDSLFISNDYFLSDLEVLQPYGNIVAGGGSTTESSPEPSAALNNLSTYQTPASMSTNSNQSPQVASLRRQSVHRANTFPNPAYESMFPNNLEAGFVEDLTFPNGIKESATPVKPSLDRTRTSIDFTTKRSKNKPDILSACWTSPLCPNHDQDGPPPNPSTCGGGCAPFLFADQDNLPNINNLLSEPQEVTAEDGIVEIQPRPKKRAESETSTCETTTGRHFTKPSKTATELVEEARQRMKTETTDDSPVQDSPPVASEEKPKNRRRLPHNQVERKYRESLNTQLDSLRRVVPSLQQNNRGCDGADIEDLPTPSKPSKAVILASATAHIKQQEKDKKALADENALLRARVKALQALVKCDDCSLMQYVMDMKINNQVK